MNKELTKTKEDKDCRALTDVFLEKFKPGKTLHPFVQLVKDHPELEFCLRGNSSPEQVIIYRNNHAMFKITAKTVYFNPNYLRYCHDWENILEKLYKYGYCKGKKIELDDVKKSKKGYSCSFKTAPAFAASISKEYLDNLEEVYKTLSDIFDVYFSDDKEYCQDRFLDNKGYTVFNKHNKLEKIRQQQLFSDIKQVQSGYYFYDMEYQQKHKDKDERKADIDNEQNNKPDMQAIRFDEKGKAKAWVFVEVKCTKAAYDGESGLEKHISKMKNYPMAKLEERRREAYLLLHQYKELGFGKLSKTPDAKEFEKLSYENLLVFTDEAIDLWKNDPNHVEDHKNDKKVYIKDKKNDKKIAVILCNPEA